MESPKKRLHLHGVMDKTNCFCREEGGVIPCLSNLLPRRGEHLPLLRVHSDTVRILVFAQAWSLLGLFYFRETFWPVTGALILLLEGVDYCFGGNRYLIFIFSQGREFCPTPHYQLCWHFAFGKEAATLTGVFIVSFPTPCSFCFFALLFSSSFQICWLLQCLSCFSQFCHPNPASSLPVFLPPTPCKFLCRRTLLQDTDFLSLLHKGEESTH